MPEYCHSCEITRYKLNELMQQYQQLLLTKDEQIICSRRIISQLEHELSQERQNALASGLYVKEVERNAQKTILEQQESIQYLKLREVKLLEQLQGTEKEIFRLAINVDDIQEGNKEGKEKENQRRDFVTLKKNVVVSNSGNITLNKQRDNNTLDRLLQESTIRVGGSQSKDSLRLKVTEDKLQLMNIKYKMALLKTVELATLR